jgi:hypothetical protein
VETAANEQNHRDILTLVRQMGGRRPKITQGGKHGRVVFTDLGGKQHSLLMPQGSRECPRAHVNRRAQLRRIDQPPTTITTNERNDQ